MGKALSLQPITQPGLTQFDFKLTCIIEYFYTDLLTPTHMRLRMQALTYTLSNCLFVC